MNIAETGDPRTWSLSSFGVAASILTILTLVLAMFRIEMTAWYRIRTYFQQRKSSSSPSPFVGIGNAPWPKVGGWIRKHTMEELRGQECVMEGVTDWARWGGAKAWHMNAVGDLPTLLVLSTSSSLLLLIQGNFGQFPPHFVQSFNAWAVTRREISNPVLGIS